MPEATSNQKWFTMPSEQVAKELGVDPAKGLSKSEVEARKQKYGANVLAGKKKEPGWQKFLRQYNDFMQILLLGAAVVMIGDMNKERLEHARSVGFEPIDLTKSDRLEELRLKLEERFERVPGGVTAILHPSSGWLAAAHPFLPAARLAATPAGRRYLAGWATRTELHTLTDSALERRADEGVPVEAVCLPVRSREDTDELHDVRRGGDRRIAVIEQAMTHVVHVRRRALLRRRR